MKRTYCVPCLIIIILFFLSCITVFGQNRFPGGGGDGQTFTLSAGMDNTSFQGIGINAGFIIEDFLYIGGDWNMDFVTLGEKSAREISLGLLAAAALLTADDQFPVSCNVSGMFRKINFTGAYLEEQELVKSGTGFSIEGDIFRDFFLSKPGSIRGGVTAGYSSSTYTTEPEAGLTDYSQKEFEENINYWYGLVTGASFFPTEKMVLSFEIRGSLDRYFHIIYGLCFGLSSSKSEMGISSENRTEE